MRYHFSYICLQTRYNMNNANDLTTIYNACLTNSSYATKGSVLSIRNSIREEVRH